MKAFSGELGFFQVSAKAETGNWLSVGELTRGLCKVFHLEGITSLMRFNGFTPTVDDRSIYVLLVEFSPQTARHK